ncbi:MAG: M48 family metallopeptidase [Brevinematales bacterium]|nr:M48 family metallopeptidase [Brevinematales bacterium]
MTWFQYLALGIYVLEIAAGRILSAMNYNHMRRHGDIVPPEFADTLTPDRTGKSLDYTRDKTRIGTWEQVWNSLVTVAFLFTPLLGIYHSWVSSLGMTFITGGIFFFLMLSVASLLADIPFDLIFTFGIEKKYGFNSMTPGLWIGDFVKGLLVNLIFTSLLIAGALAIIEASPDYWWLIIWGFFTLYTVFMLYISPYVIEPLFNKYKPLERPGLEERIRDLLGRAGIHVSKIYMMDASKRTLHTNAYFTGIGRNKRIVFYDTLLQKLDDDEILSVLAHEAGHWKKGHFIKRLAGMTVLSLGVFALVFAVVKWGIVRALFPVSGAGILTDLIVIGFCGSLLGFLFAPLSNWLSRRDERQADHYAHTLTGSGDKLIASLVKLSADNLSALHPHPLYAKFYYSHPPVLERIAYLRSLN